MVGAVASGCGHARSWCWRLATRRGVAVIVAGVTSSRPPRFRASDGIVLRTPALPVGVLLHWPRDEDAARRYLETLVDDATVREAVFVASPSLSEAIEVWRKAPLSAAGQRAEHALVKYLARMSARATPFGLFSAISVGQLGKTTSLELAPKAEYRRRTRIDNDYLFVLAEQLAGRAETRAKLTYRPNTSMYRHAGRIRYAVARMEGTERRYHLAAVDATPYIEATLARAASGARRDVLAAALVGDEVALEDATAFIDELIEEQLLVSELGVFVTGSEPLDALLDQLRAADIAEPIPVLERARADLAAIDAGGTGASSDRYRAVATALEVLPAKPDIARLFQVDMIKPAAATLSTRIISDVARVIEQLVSFVPTPKDPLDGFKQAFRARYEGAVVPLTQVLDEESGIGFQAANQPGQEGAPLLAGLDFPDGPGEDRERWSTFDKHMLKRLHLAIAAGADEIVLDAADMQAMKLRDPTPAPEAFAATLRLERDPTDPRAEPTVYFDSAAGPPGARLLGRFAHASRDVETIVRAHLAAEQALHPDAVFAEIVHLDEGRVGNILCRPVLRSHELVYLGLSGAPRDAQITLDDLLVAVRDDRVVLVSERLGKEVVPRLTTAHNFRGSQNLGAYRFLCALAAQGVWGVSWSWGVLKTAPFLPRVRIENVLVDRAVWNLDKQDLASITTAVRAASNHPEQRGKVLDAVAALRTARKLPRWFVVADGDNELPIDLDNPLLAAAFANEVAGVEAAALVEPFPSLDRPAVLGPEGGYANEVIVPYVQTKLPARSITLHERSTIRRDFPPGSEWLYAKIYCGESTADRVLTEAIAPVVREGSERRAIDRWFFIRYADPDHHVRVRFHGTPERLRDQVWPALESATAPLREVGAVHRLALDTYVREIERYGGDRGIELVEDVFWHDSEAVLGIVELLDGSAGAIARWKLALRGIDSLLEALGFAADARARVFATARDDLGRDHHAGPALWAQLGERFARERADLELVFARDVERDAEHELQPGFELLARRDAALVELGRVLARRDTA
ncbi:MAG TPA: lantibiotic dehydratase, partial [Kofleriaceae bacterium]|nr:lantibiotic dehydratase [Kofleriaceae bacterium]